MRLIPIAAAAAAFLGALPAHAACQMASAQTAVTMQGLRPLVGVKVAGKPVKLLLDSGAAQSFLDAKFVAAQKLKGIPFRPTGSHLNEDTQVLISGARGQETASGVVTADLEVDDGSRFAGVPFFTAPALGDVTGLLGQNFLHMADAEYDLKHGALRLVRTTGCEKTDLAYWVKTGESYSVAPLEFTDRNNYRTRISVLINGEKMRAFLDTGADTSFITARAAARAGVKTTDPGVKPAGVSHGVDGDVKIWLAPFASIKIGDEEIRNTRLAIGDSRAEDFDVLIGADFFLAHRVYVANSQGKLYFSYEGGPVFKPPTPDAPASSAETRPR